MWKNLNGDGSSLRYCLGQMTQMLCISTSFWVLRTPESCPNSFFQPFSTFFCSFLTFFSDFRHEINKNVWKWTKKWYSSAPQSCSTCESSLRGSLKFVLFQFIFYFFMFIFSFFGWFHPKNWKRLKMSKKGYKPKSWVKYTTIMKQHFWGKFSSQFEMSSNKCQFRISPPMNPSVTRTPNSELCGWLDFFDFFDFFVLECFRSFKCLNILIF